MAIAAELAPMLRAGDVIALAGMLGAGKTCFVKGLARGLGLADTSIVTSPTFVLVNEYPTRPPLYHFDAYRMRGSEEMSFLGFADYVDSGGICVVEWADHVRNCLPGTHLAVIIEHVTETTRRVTFCWSGDVAEDRQKALAGLAERLHGWSDE